MVVPESVIGGSIDRGTILLGRFSNIDHPKFFVVIGVYEDTVAGYFFINSNINTNVIKGQEQLKLQYVIRPSDYPFLDYDSYICATTIKPYNKKDIVEGVMKGSVKIKDRLKDEHLNEILGLTRASKLFSPDEKRKYLY